MRVMTGCCEVCGRRYRLRKDGTMGSHYIGLDRDICPGYKKLPRWAEHNRRLREATEAGK